jgi:hypothetical protein
MGWCESPNEENPTSFLVMNIIHKGDGELSGTYYIPSIGRGDARDIGRRNVINLKLFNKRIKFELSDEKETIEVYEGYIGTYQFESGRIIGIYKRGPSMMMYPHYLVYHDCARAGDHKTVVSENGWWWDTPYSPGYEPRFFQTMLEWLLKRVHIPDC